MLVMWSATLYGKQMPFVATDKRIFVLIGAVCCAVVFRRRVLVVTLVACALGMINGASAWWAADPPVSGACGGIATFVDDPEQRGRAVYAIVSIDGIRYRAVAYGITSRRIIRRQMGEQVLLTGTCAPLSGRFVEWDRQRHILGRIDIQTVSEEFSAGSPMYRSANRLRQHIVDAMRYMHPADRALFAGLVMGEDRDQPRSMIMSFRASGLSHLCAVSGQNVAYVLAAAGVFLRGRRPTLRVILTCALLAWFVVITRAEPSVVRASVMAGIVAMAFALGRQTNTKEVLCVTAMALLCIDPMMARSVGFMLSTAATAGLAWVSPLMLRVVGDGPVRKILAATMAAHLGTAPISLFYFHNLPVIALIANPFAVPIAGFVMLVGLPISLLVSLAPDFVHIPLVYALEVPVRLLWWIAVVSDAVSPRGLPNVLCWCGVIWFLVWRYRHASPKADVAG
jgi:competence protein ComEC